MAGKPRIGFILGQPTQFDAPFFRHAQASGKAHLVVMYVAANPSDRELSHQVDWGIDLFSGYEHKTLPARGRLAWLWNELRPERYDWVIINGYTTLPYFAASVVARVRGIRTGLRIDSVLYNAGGWRRQLRKRLVLSLLSRWFGRFFATGTLAIEYLVHFGVARDKIALFPYLVEAERFVLRAVDRDSARAALRARLGIPQASRVVLAVAKMNSREAPWDLLGALENLDRPDLWTVLIGDGEQLESLRSRAAAGGIPRVVFAGYVPFPELAQWYAMADLFVHAAVDEPWGVSVHEAIASGLPVVASSRVGAATDLVMPGRNGFVYAVGDPADLRAKLLAALDTFDPAQVRTASQEVLAKWNYSRAWEGILEALA